MLQGIISMVKTVRFRFFDGVDNAAGVHYSRIEKLLERSSGERPYQ